MIGTPRNREITGRRTVSALSRIARNIENVRHTDLDLTQWCPRCKRPQVFAEVKRILTGDHEWDQARRHAAFYGHHAIALLVVENSTSIGVKVFSSDDGSISPVKWGTGKDLQEIMENARDNHECY